MKTLRVPCLLFALPAMLVAFPPSFGDWLVLDRAAIADGQLWRLWSGHWVHFSASHLAWNLLVLLVTGTWLECVRPGLLGRHTLAAAPLIGLVVLGGEPQLDSYGGLSGLATGVVVLLALHHLRAPGAPRLAWNSVLVLVAVKLLHDLAAPDTLFARYDLPGVRTSATAHAAGATVALLHHAVGRLPGGSLSRVGCGPSACTFAPLRVLRGSSSRK